jgi:AcrR family transcriptional regulator
METQDPTKVRLLEAAGEEFARKGFDSARIRAICDRAEANIAAVNYHFGDKEQLYIEALLEAHHCGGPGDGEDLTFVGTPAEQLRGFINHFLCHVLAIDHPDDWRHLLMLREMLHPTSASDVLIRERIRPRFEELQRILRQFCPAADDRRLNALTFSVIGQCLHYRMARTVTERLIGRAAHEALDIEYLTDHITSFCLAALGCAPPINEAGESLGQAASAAS